MKTLTLKHELNMNEIYFSNKNQCQIILTQMRAKIIAHRRCNFHKMKCLLRIIEGKQSFISYIIKGWKCLPRHSAKGLAN